MKIRNKVIAAMMALCVASSVIPATIVEAARPTETPQSEEVRPTKTPEGEEVKPTKTPEGEKVKPTKTPEGEKVKPTKTPKPNKVTTADVPAKSEKTDKETTTNNKNSVKKTKVKWSKVKGKKNKVTLKWKKVSDVSGYEIYRATSKNGKYKKVKTVTSNSKTTYVNKNLKTGKKYYYKIRTYKKVNGKKVYGNYSAVKTVKTK